MSSGCGSWVDATPTCCDCPTGEPWLTRPTTLPLEHMPSHYKADLLFAGVTTLRGGNFAASKNDFQCRQVLYRPVKRFERGYVTTGISFPDGNDHPESRRASLQAITSAERDRRES